MSSVDTAAQGWAETLIDRERRRSGVAKPLARAAVARRIGVAPGSFENLDRGRVKGVRAWFYERLRDAFIREGEQELRRLAHELAMARAAGLRDDQSEVRAVKACIEALRKEINV